MSLCSSMGLAMERGFFKLAIRQMVSPQGKAVACFSVSRSSLYGARCRMHHPGQLAGADEKAVGLEGAQRSSVCVFCV